MSWFHPTEEQRLTGSLLSHHLLCSMQRQLKICQFMQPNIKYKGKIVRQGAFDVIFIFLGHKRHVFLGSFSKNSLQRRILPRLWFLYRTDPIQPWINFDSLSVVHNKGSCLHGGDTLECRFLCIFRWLFNFVYPVLNSWLILFRHLQN